MEDNHGSRPGNPERLSTDAVVLRSANLDGAFRAAGAEPADPAGMELRQRDQRDGEELGLARDRARHRGRAQLRAPARAPDGRARDAHRGAAAGPAAEEELRERFRQAPELAPV